MLPQIADICASAQYTISKIIGRSTQRALLYCLREELIPRDNANLVSKFYAKMLPILHDKYCCLCYKAELPVDDWKYLQKRKIIYIYRIKLINVFKNQIN